jgi:hypothetical protein
VVAIYCPDFAVPSPARSEQVLQRKCQAAPSARFGWRLNRDMQILISIGIVAMLALYAVIIVRCYRQPEW